MSAAGNGPTSQRHGLRGSGFGDLRPEQFERGDVNSFTEQVREGVPQFGEVEQTPAGIEVDEEVAAGSCAREIAGGSSRLRDNRSRPRVAQPCFENRDGYPRNAPRIRVVRSEETHESICSPNVVHT